MQLSNTREARIVVSIVDMTEGTHVTYRVAYLDSPVESIRHLADFFVVQFPHMRLRLLISTLILAGVIALLQDIALAEFLYWKWWWFDILMHFLGGVLVGGIGLIISDVLKTPQKITLLLSLLSIGIGWEIFEYTFGLYDGAWDPVDTSIDLIMDTLGVLVVYSGVKLWK